MSSMDIPGDDPLTPTPEPQGSQQPSIPAAQGPEQPPVPASHAPQPPVLPAVGSQPPVPPSQGPQQPPVQASHAPQQPPVPPASGSQPPPVQPAAVASARGSQHWTLALAALIVLVAAFGGAALAHFAWPPANTSSSPLSGLVPANGGSSVPANGGSSGLFGSRTGGSAPVPSASESSVAAQIDPGIVDVNTVTSAGPAAGTGMVVTSNGEVITNNHVISGASQISVYDVGTGKTYSARVLGYDRSQDVAVLQLSGASGLPTVPLGDSSTLRVGAAVVTIGNAGGLGGTPSVASGTVAALHRSITAGDSYEPGNTERLKGVIQIAGALEPGDSGGPLVSGGKVVGMDTAASSTFSFRSAGSGQGFAIPINQALTISRQIVASQSSSRVHVGGTALIGVYVSNNARCQSAAGLFGTGSGAAGAVVCGVVAGTPAAGTSLSSTGTGNAYDTITALGGSPVTSSASLLSLMDTHHPGDRVLLTWVDASGGSHSATVTLTSGPPD